VGCPNKFLLVFVSFSVNNEVVAIKNLKDAIISSGSMKIMGMKGMLP